MARVKIVLPQQFNFSTFIPVRITDINYGGHVGNDTVLSIIHEARVQYLKRHGYDELNLDGVGIIMSDAAIEFKAELFYGDIIEAYVAASDFTGVAFTLFYKLQKDINTQKVTVAIAKTGMICFDYNRKKIVPVPAKIKLVLK